MIKEHSMGEKFDSSHFKFRKYKPPTRFSRLLEKGGLATNYGVKKIQDYMVMEGNNNLIFGSYKGTPIGVCHDNRYSNRNWNTFVLAGETDKGWKYHTLPNLLAMHSSAVIVEKPERYTGYLSELQKNGCNLFLVDFSNRTETQVPKSHYNPFVHFWESKADKFNSYERHIMYLTDTAASLFHKERDKQCAAHGYMLDSEIDFATGKNQEGVGYWVSMEGKVVNWGNDAMFYVTPKADDYSKFGVGQYPGHMNIGDSARATLYFVAGSKYYQLNVDLVIVAPKQGDVVFESVAQRSIEVQQVPVAYTWASRVEIPEAWVEQQLGTSDWVLYALAPLNDDGSEKEGNAKYSKSYSISESPGFWMDGEGHNIGWSGNARVGVSISQPSGHFALMQYENSINLGDVFRFPLFLVNEENGKMVTFNFTYSIVESVVEIEEVGSEDIVLPVSADDEGASVTIDLSDVLKAFDITLDALANGQYLHGITADGTYGSGVSLYDGLAFTNSGVCVTEDPFMFFEAELNEDGKSITVTTCATADVADDYSAIGTVCFLIEGKRYVLNVKFVSETVFTGITENRTVPHTSLSAVYDLQGRKVVKTQRGLYIQNGRKYMVK